MKQYSEYRFGDMLAAWWLDEKNHMGMTLIPAEMKDRVREHRHTLEGLVQIHARGDQLPNGYGNGSTLATTTATDALRFVSQKKDGDTVSVIPGDILYIESVDDRIFAYTAGDVIRLEGSLAGIIQKLNDDRFFRCSKSMIINIDKVERLRSLSSNRIDATMEGGEHILISRTYASEFRRILKGV